jgi:hypothetical protein
MLSERSPTMQVSAAILMEPRLHHGKSPMRVYITAVFEGSRRHVVSVSESQASGYVDIGKSVLSAILKKSMNKEAAVRIAKSQCGL